jgi:hypothetical protein
MRWIKTTQTLIGYGKASKKFQEILYQSRAAKSIQAKIRGYLARKKYLSRLHAVINVQTRNFYNFIVGSLSCWANNDFK